MANKSYTYRVYWSLKEDGNRTAEDYVEVQATTVPRAISKAIKELNVNGEGGYLDSDHEEYLRASDILVIHVANLGFKNK